MSPHSMQKRRWPTVRRRTQQALVLGTATALRLPGGIVLSGIPGSGKSTLAAGLKARGWFIVNQDTLGNRKRCEAKFIEAISAGQRVVVDRCNQDAHQRSNWLRLAKDVPLISVWLDAPLDLCLSRVMARTGHPTLGPNSKSMTIIRNFEDSFRPPSSRREKFADFIHLRVPQDTNDLTAILDRLDMLTSSEKDDDTQSTTSEDTSFTVISPAPRPATTSSSSHADVLPAPHLTVPSKEAPEQTGGLTD